MKNKIMGGWFKDTINDKYLYITLVASVLVAIFGDELVLREVAGNMGQAMVQLSSALLGIVIAGLAIFIVFLDKKYVALLRKVTDLERNLWPFKFVALLTVLSLILGMVLVIIGNPPTIIIRIVIGLALWSYLYLLLEIYWLIKFLTGHLKVRAKQIELEDENKV